MNMQHHYTHAHRMQKSFTEVLHKNITRRGAAPLIVILGALLTLAVSCGHKNQPTAMSNIDSNTLQATLDALREEASGFPEMTLDEINAEISAARAERKARR